MRHLLAVDDLVESEVDAILDRAAQFRSGAPVDASASPQLVGLCFYSSSLRTRVGFAAAAHRIGCHSVDVIGPRWTEAMSEPESFDDSLRTLSGMVDVVVGRTPFAIDTTLIDGCCLVPYVNGGDRGGEHPTQALIDLWAIRGHGELATMEIAIVGDLTARTVRSLVALLGRTPPGRLVLAGPDNPDDVVVTGPLVDRTERVSAFDPAGLDVVYLAGLPQSVGAGHVDVEERANFALDARRAACLRPDAIVLSPMPVIDELSSEVRGDKRVRMFQQSDSGLFVRMAVLERVLSR